MPSIPARRLLLVSDVDPVQVIGGAERMLREHSTRLAAAGYRVVVLTRAGEGRPPGEMECEGVRVVRHPVREGNAPAFFRSVLTEGGAAFARLHAEERFDLVNIHQPLAGAAVVRRPESRNLPILYTYLSPWHDEYRTRALRAQEGAAGGALRRTLRQAWMEMNTHLRRRTEAECVRRADRLLVLSHFTISQLQSIHGADPGRITLIPGGVDTSRFQPPSDRPALRRSLGLQPQDELLFTVRNLVPRMGLDSLITAMSTVVARRPHCRLWIGGSGPLRTTLEEQVRAQGLEQHVRFLGFVAEADLPDHYGAADAFVLPTRMLEGFGLVTVEAMACGTPALGTPVGGTQEILSRFDPGMLFADAEPESLAHGILNFLEAEGDREALRARCRRHAEQEYGWDALIPRLQELIEECLKPGTPGPGGAPESR